MNEPNGSTSLLLRQQHNGDLNCRNDLIAHACERLENTTCEMMKGFIVVKRWEQTDDVLNNALVRLNNALSSSVPQSSRHFWNLATEMIRRELIDMARHYRQHYGFAANHHTDKQGRAADDPGGPVHTYSDERDGFVTLEELELVDKLPEDERTVFKMIWYGKLKLKEVAAFLNISVRTVERRWLKARLLLSKALDQGN
jgi:RNA polymerase sigma factor (sigma-70 family)